MDAPNLQLCRICITNSNCAQMISIFGEDSLWKKITLLADVQIEKDDTLPQQVCITCAKNAISACLFKKKCEDADNFFRQQLLIRKIEGKTSAKVGGNDVITVSEEDEASENEQESGENWHNNDTDNDEDDGEIKMENEEKPPNFDFNSIRLMHEYMQQHLSKINGNNSGSGSDNLGDDDEPLPLIPEIELLTPTDEVNTNVMPLNVDNNNAQLRGYQCTICYQIFEMKQLLKHHMQSVHGTSGPVYECANCKKTYFYKRFLEKHIRRGRCVKKRRNQTRPMQCSDCHVLFPTGHHLGWHKRTGCPSRTGKMPLQQLFKQNIVQYNNFPKRIGIRKPENAIYLHNRKLIMASNKRKGRTRIKLDAKKIALAKQLILREATTTVIANELNISRTFAWRLRKSLVNGVSLHERVIDPSAEEQAELQQPEVTTREQPQQQFPQNKNVCIKSEQMESENSDEESHDDEENTHNNMNNGDNRVGNYEQTHEDNEVGKDRFKDDGNDANDDSDSSVDKDNAERDGDEVLGVDQPLNCNKQQIYLEHQNSGSSEHENISAAESSNRMQLSNNFKAYSNTERQQELNFKNSLQHSLPLLNGFPAAVAAAIHQLPVNLSIKPIASLQNPEYISSNTSNQVKKPRKPNVFIDDEKYAMAKMLVAQNSSTMEIARQLNVSQMTAWKVRDAIVKGIPLSYRSKREVRSTITPDAVQAQVVSPSKHHHQTQQKQQLQQQQDQQLLPQEHHQQHPQQHHQQHQQHQQQQQQLQHQEQHQQQQHHQQQQQHQQQLHHQHLMQLSHSVQHTHSITSPPILGQRDAVPPLLPSQALPTATTTKSGNPRRRLKAAERELRDKEITREILEMIKEDSNIQYWKVSARLAEKGYPISPSSVCQKLKSMGIHRRWKPGDKPPMLDLEQLKSNGVLGPSTETDESFDYNNSNEQQFDLGGAHFLSAFTR